MPTAPPEIKEMVEKTQRHFKAKEKLKQLGTNGVPLLLNLLWTSKSLKEKEQALIARDHLQAPPERAVAGLTEYLNSGQQAELSALVLARQGPKAIAPLISSRTNRITAVRQAVAWHLAEFHPDGNGNLRISINGDERIWRGFQSKADLYLWQEARSLGAWVGWSVDDRDFLFCQFRFGHVAHFHWNYCCGLFSSEAGLLIRCSPSMGPHSKREWLCLIGTGNPARRIPFPVFDQNPPAV